MKSKNMNNSKASLFTEFEIVAFSGLQEYKTLLFLGFLILFLITLTANLLILFFVAVDHRLHTPMYFFLWNLSLLDLLMTIAIIPKLLAVLLDMNKKISFGGCFFQMYFIIAVGGSELCLVAAMAYDRYVAIVKPLQYNVIIDMKTCLSIAATVWIVGFLLTLVSITWASYLPFCGSNKILHCFCDYPVVIALTCTDVTLHANLAFSLAMLVIFIPFLFVLWSYYRIVISVVRLKSTASRTKAFSMCSSHLLVVLLYYLSTAVLYIGFRIESISYDERIFIGGLNYFLTPMVNPLIYTLRNEKMKEAAKKYLNVYTLFQYGLQSSG
ncbi:olfactory receptor 10A2-like [Erpetoichthys calabaricus]|uniref:olfactory receptor 10A2-like n=1 Tax=Erpetoichthys calabaricus TaxID=27687 RepID=UPI00109FE2EF|nr:olfactory receptor 10A2-like [Erpetoichthys calabaricus]